MSEWLTWDYHDLKPPPTTMPADQPGWPAPPVQIVWLPPYDFVSEIYKEPP